MPNNQLWTQPVFPVSFDEDFDAFGTALIAGDFNGDGLADLSIGTPNEDIGATTNTGRASVLYGSFAGLTSVGSQVWDQGVLDGSLDEAFDQFSFSLASGDFDGDGFDDLAAGAPGEDWNSISSAGAVNVVYGSFFGLSSAGNEIWSEDSAILGSAEVGDRFGETLASGDFDGDGFDDLAIGVPEEDVGFTTDAGKVNIMYGSSVGLTTFGNDIIFDAVSESFDSFGSSLSTGDFDGDGFDDLAVGTPDENLFAGADAGAVNVVYGSLFGLDTATQEFWAQDTVGVLGVSEAFDNFGESLAAEDFDGDGYDDLAIGVPEEGSGNHGAVNVLHGSFFGLTSVGDQIWNQNQLNGSSAEVDDFFGASLAVGDFNQDGYDDLVVGAPEENLGNVVDAGAVNVIYGSFFGLSSVGNQFWTQDSLGVQGTAEAFDRFGSSLAVHDFNGDGYDDLAIGVPGEDIGAATNAGAVNILYGSAIGLTA